MDSILTSLDIKNPGLRALPPGVERYLVRGGGLSVITLDPDDKIEITDTEGKQKCEIIAATIKPFIALIMFFSPIIN